MQNVRRFLFTGENEGDHEFQERLNVTIPESLEPQYGMYVWPSAVVLAQYVWYYRRDIKGKNILELGAGTALPGIVAAKCGANVVLSDNSRFPYCLENCKKSCIVNDLANMEVLGITWGHFNPELLSLKCLQYIIASDCFYDCQDFEDIIATVALLLDRNKECQFLCTYQVRSTNWCISDLLEKWNLTSRNILLSSFCGDSPCLAQSDLPGRHTIQMMQITKMQNTYEGKE